MHSITGYIHYNFFIITQITERERENYENRKDIKGNKKESSQSFITDLALEY